MAQLRRINFDSTWLLTLPNPADHPTSTCNLLIDPWLSDAEQIDLVVSFSGQKRQTAALASSIGELESVLEQENVANSASDDRPPSNKIDAIVISHPFSDHLHPETLTDERVAERIPIFVTQDAEGALRKVLGSKGKSNSITVIKAASMDTPPGWISEKSENKNSTPLPNNMEILQALPQEKFLYFQGPAGMAWKKLHGGLIFLWRSTNAESLNSIVYSPHGLTPKSIPTWLTNKELSIQHWAILTMFDKLELPHWLSGTVNLGLAAVLEMIQGDSNTKPIYPARYIIDTHGEFKDMRGLIARLLRRYWLNTDQLIQDFDAEREATRAEKAQQAIDQIEKTENTTSKATLLQVGESVSFT
ncbi:uncharacterized protein FA14DRAFT_69974 [Meira miltonrushii]|uniref:Metallo-beta-lactamase domain-containing protein n=1 Tax=Meira miltonrushii TaxID=1280837 RepID=A0A316VFC6_9BASI|nr:uncharacterized protein FA14DRAFT_69974 [Meira miltonrushii]PWN34175.1 hypothetical protein FA14DRAFT_69974 [Meira miltonrushii]